MKKCGSTSTPTASKPMNEPKEILNLSSIDSMTMDEQRNVNPICQPFSMRCSEDINMVDNDGEREISYTSPLELLARVAEMASDLPQLEETCQISDAEKDVSFVRRTAGISIEAINMVDNDGEREIPYTSPLELLVRVAEMASDLPQLEETCQISDAEKDSSFERRIAGISIEVNDLVNSDDERKYKKFRSLNELVKVDEKESAGQKGVTTTRQQMEKKLSLSKGKGIGQTSYTLCLTSTGEEYVGPLRSGKAKATGSSPQPLLPRNRRNPNGIAGDINKAPVEVIILDDSEDEGINEQTEKRPCLDKGKKIITEVLDNGQTSRTFEPSQNINRGPLYGKAALDDLNSRIARAADILRNQQQERRNISSSRTLDLSLSLCCPGTKGNQVENKDFPVESHRKRKGTVDVFANNSVSALKSRRLIQMGEFLEKPFNCCEIIDLESPCHSTHGSTRPVASANNGPEIRTALETAGSGENPCRFQ